jgi:hypothetical protein
MNYISILVENILTNENSFPKNGWTGLEINFSENE